MLFARALLITLALLASSAANAQTMSLKDEFSKKIKAANTIEPLGSDLFGNNTNPSTGKTEFSNIDISLPGNSKLPVQLGRRLNIDHRYMPEELGGLGNWDLDVPYIEGTFSKNVGWAISSTGDNRYQRCSSALPPAVEGAKFSSQEAWHGYRVHVPGVLDETMLAENNAFPDPTDGLSYPWILKSMGRVGCLPTAKNGYPGEGYFLKTTDGTKYYFDYPVERKAATLYKAQKGVPGYSMERKRVFMLATRIEDRFGNYVDYNYSNGRLVSVVANDDRRIDINYGTITGGVQSGTITATANGKNWSYILQNGQLTEVKQPDGHAWKYSPFGSHTTFVEGDPNQEPLSLSFFSPEAFCQDSFDSRYTGNLSFNVTHPSGAVGQFNFEGTHFFRSQVPYQCLVDFFDHEVRVNSTSAPIGNTGLSGRLEYYYDSNGQIRWEFVEDVHSQMEVWILHEEYAEISGHARIIIPNYFALFSLKNFAISGNNISSQTTQYNYNSEALPYCDQYDSQTGQITSVSCSLPDPCPEYGCADGIGRWVETTLPNGDKVRKRFGVVFAKNEGELLAEEVVNAAGVVVKRVDYKYIQDNEMAGQPFAGAIGVNFSSDPSETRIRPMVSSKVLQQGVEFNNVVTGFNNFAQPVGTTKSSSLGYTRSDTVEYENNLTKWVLGQVKTVTDTSATPHVALSKTEYDPVTALPLRNYSFGQTQPDTTFTYLSDGNVSTVKDALNHTTTLSDYYRGIPRLISFADTTSISALVNPDGTIASTTDQLGSATTYEYDLMGRLTKKNLPTGDTNPWVSMNYWFRKKSDGKWAQSTWNDRYAKEVIVDDFWRPTLQTEWDFASPTATVRQTVWRYDAQGRTVFQSYPFKGVTDFSTLLGIHTEYDALGRVTKTKQDSEQGQLSTTTEYLTGFKTKVTNPRGFATTTSYQVFDAPDTSRPEIIVAPESQTTTILRNVYGNPLSVTRSGIWNGSPLSSTRSYVYDPQQRLCKRIEPETGATVLDYDAVGNLLWSVQGSALTGNTCDRPSVAAADKTIRSYDLLNRIKTTDVPGSTNDLTYDYFADGALKSLINGTNRWDYTYNKLRLPVTEQFTIDGRVKTLTHAYDNYGNESSLTYPSGLVVDRLPNALNQATKAGTFATGVAYYPNGGMSGFVYGNGIQHSLTQNQRQLPVLSADMDGSTAILHDTYAYDANGNVASITDGTAGAGGNRAMIYDNLDRLTQTTAPNLAWMSNTFSYDALDNIRVSTLGSRTYNYQYNATTQRLDQLKLPNGSVARALTYDTQGNVTTNGGAQNYAFDKANRMQAVTNKENYEYDGHGRRVKITKYIGKRTSYPLYSLEGKLITEEDSRIDRTIDYIYLNGSLVAKRSAPILSTPTYTTTYLHTDSLGSPVAESNAAKTVTRIERYTPYGEPTDQTYDQGPGFTGHVTDAATGLTYAQQRYYDPVIGRFLSADPMESDTTTAWNFNRYNYAANNPYKYTDPDGRSIWLRFAKLVKNGGNLALTFQGIREDAAALHKSKNFGVRVLYGISIASEIAPLSVGDVKDGYRYISKAVKDGDSLSTDKAIDVALDHLGDGYKEIAPGVFKSADGTRMVRMTDSDLAKTGNHAGEPHINIETGKTVTKPNGKETFISEENKHIFLPEEKK